MTFHGYAEGLNQAHCAECRNAVCRYAELSLY
jgi:hypothetical protein